jgi:hypothetical protein
MANPLFTPMVIAAKIHKYFSRFENAGAISSETSKTLVSLGLHGGLIFNRLIRKGVFIEAAPGKYYVSRSTYDKYRTQRKRTAILVMSGILITFVVVMVSYFF